MLKTFEHDVLLVRQTHPVSPVLLLSEHEFEPTPVLFLAFYDDLIKWAN
jgi:hypothetical protein